jgi:type II secretory pathway pseudopilin PulG
MKKELVKTGGGFTIVELIVAMFVGITLVTATNTLISNYLRLGQRSRSVVLANSYVEGKVEALRNRGYNGISLGTTSLSSELPSALPKPKTASLQVSTQAPGIKKISISVTYYDQGVNRTYSYATYIGELGVGQ